MNANKQKRLKELSEINLELGYREDIVINGLGWVKLVDKAKVNIYIDKNVEVFTRRNFV